MKRKLSKKILIKILMFVSVFSVLCSILFVPALAAEAVPFADISLTTFTSGYYVFKEDLSDQTPSISQVSTEFYYYDGYQYVFADNIEFQYRGYFVINYVSGTQSLTVYNDSGWVNDNYRTVFFPENFDFADYLTRVWFSGLLDPLSTLTPVSDGSYYMIYEVLKNYIYGANKPLTSDMQLTLTFLSTIGTLFIVAVPFIVVYFILRLLRFI